MVHKLAFSLKRSLLLDCHSGTGNLQIFRRSSTGRFLKSPNSIASEGGTIGQACPIVDGADISENLVVPWFIQL